MKKEKEFAIAIAKKSGSFLLSRFGRIKKGSRKSETEIQLSEDKLSEKLIINAIKKSFPGHNILAEEFGRIDRESNFTWIVDPLDGTHNYAHGLPIFSTSIALAKNSKVKLGVIYFPFLKELYVAEKDAGAFLNGKRITVSKTRDLNDAMMFFGGTMRTGTACLVKRNYYRAVNKVFKGRVLGAETINFAFVASGKADFLIEHNSKPWDHSAGALIVEEAGGKVTNHKGKPWNPYTKKLIASNKLLYDAALKIVRD